ncbi:integumentary mucin C.1-like [Bacillus rossius redtenbacheri]|uniref:integumentary mucin C.1-like n=1 Tax=Bacillus rossius redtenbacheri TaxID=93214 RepID=UPI002FDE8C41
MEDRMLVTIFTFAFVAVSFVLLPVTSGKVGERSPIQPVVQTTPANDQINSSTPTPNTTEPVITNVPSNDTNTTTTVKPTTPTTIVTTTLAPKTTVTTPNTTTPTTPTTPAPDHTTVPPTTTPAPNTTTTVPPTKPTVVPASTTAAPTVPPSKDRRFDGPSFVGGIVLCLGILAIGFVAFKFYKARTERNYHTL